VFDAAVSSDAVRLNTLLRAGRVWQVHDSINLQIRDLVRARAPQRSFSDSELNREVERICGARSARTYGRWVYYAWSGRLLHLLPPNEFRQLRLDRNRNKITTQEQDRLARMSVGVVGLSIGNAIAVALAMEGIGHLRLADFDSLDLSNMNRLRAGVHEIGVSKVVLAARQIYEIDPYADVAITAEGITRDNVDAFLTGPPRVDVLVEECDSVSIKFLLRERAREHRIPVLMATSDQGMFDVERFDEEPDRPLFHGLVGTTTAERVMQASREERVALVLSLLDPEKLSTRIAASLPEVDRTLSTWPQLASDVALGAATVGTAVRSIALGEELLSGRRFIDVRAPAADTGEAAAGTGRPQARPALLAARTGNPDQTYPELIRFVVKQATLAPSGGNSQPWHFKYDGNVLWLTLDPCRAANTLDTPLNGAAILALGAAIENCVIAAAHRGLRVDVEPYPDPGNSLLAAAMRFHTDPLILDSETALLFPTIERRVTNRRLGPRVPVPDRELATLREIATVHGAHLEFITNAEDLDQVGHILGEGDRIRFFCPSLHAEMFGEIRWTPAEARAHFDGVDIATLELSPNETAAMRMIARPAVAAFLRERNEGQRLAETAEKAVAAASAVGLLTIPRDTREAWLQGGRALQRVWLAATACGLALHPWISVPYMVAMLDRPKADVFNTRERATLRTLGRRLDVLFHEAPGAPRAVLFRLGYAPQPTARSLRLPVDSVLHADGT